MKSVFAVAMFTFLTALAAAHMPEYYCHHKKTDHYEFADPGDKSVCEEKGGKFGVFSRKDRQYFCRLSDTGFYYGKKHSRAEAEKLCKELGGTLK